MWKWTFALLGGFCGLTAIFELAYRAYTALTPVQLSVGTGVFAAIVLCSPLFLKASDTDLNNIGIPDISEEQMT